MGQGIPTTAIIGAGASGTLTAIHLLRRARGSLEIVLLDRGSRPGRGVAYGTGFQSQLLNVRAGNMSAFPDEPLHFFEWLQNAEVDRSWRAESPTDFVPRMVYGPYLDAALHTAQASARDGVVLDVRQTEVIGLAPDQSTLELGGGVTLAAERSVLALGNFPPQRLGARAGHLRSGESYLRDDPWAASALEGLDPTDPVLLVGTGLTMVDVVVSLVLERRHRGQIYAVSRRGLLPQVHSAPGSYARTWAESDLPTDVLGLLRCVRAEVRLAALRGHDWRGVVDSLRPVTQAVWQHTPAVERERFLRHLQPFWDTHRHRVAERIGQVVADAQASGQLKVWAGRLARFDDMPAGVRVEITGRKGGRWTTEVARIINCTGPAVNVGRLEDPFIASLLAGGFARPDALHLGLETTTDGRLVDAFGQPSQRLFSLGPMRRGELWETTSVPDIRVHAARLADVLVSELDAA